MGLDMYLSKKTYVNQESRGNLTITGLKSKINPANVNYIIEEVAYWRKANAIHQWFVENVQDGNDDCKSYYVSEEQLKELLDTINKVLAASKLVKGKIANGYNIKEDGTKEPILETGKLIKDPTVATELLPTTSGFFFGGTDYDEYYYQDLVDTKKILEEALKDTDNMGDYEYQSSW